MATVVPMPAANVATVTSHRLFPGVARGVFVISALSGFLFFFHGCATVAPRACALTVLGSVPATAQGAAEVGVAGKVESDCEIVSPQSLAMALPTDRRTVAMAERLAYRAAVLAAATAYYEDSASGLEALEGSWAMARENPGLLPTDPADRAHVYQALGVLLLARYGESQLAGDELASWLARHLPDQVPSAQQLPPKLSVRAADALSRSHADKGTLTVGPARDCEEASLLLDGRRLGTLPLRDLPVHRGRHAIWFACGETVSWTRLLEVTETAVSLTGPKIAHEAVFDLGPGHLRLRAGAPDTSVAEPVRRLLPALGVDAIVLMPTTSGHDVLVAFSCKGRDICPSCSTRRMVETAAHMVDDVLPRVQFRQWVLSVPKRVRWHMNHKPEVVSGLLGIFLRAVETTIRQRSPDAPAGSRFGAVVFVHRFGSYLNSHIHYHVLVTDGVFSASEDGKAEFHPALELD